MLFVKLHKGYHNVEYLIPLHRVVRVQVEDDVKGEWVTVETGNGKEELYYTDIDGFAANIIDIKETE